MRSGSKSLQNEGKKDHRRHHQSLAQNGFHTEFFRQPYAKLMIVMTELAIRGQDTDHLREAAPNRVLSQGKTSLHRVLQLFSLTRS